LDLFYALNYVPGIFNVLSLNVPSEMFLDHYSRIFLNFPSLLSLFIPHKLRLRWWKRVRDKKIFFFLDPRTQQWNLFLKLVINFRVKNWFLNDLTDFVFKFDFLFCRFALVCLRLGMHWGRRWMLEFAFSAKIFLWSGVSLKRFGMGSLLLFIMGLFGLWLFFI
jgi:hypothetical protein